VTAPSQASDRLSGGRRRQVACLKRWPATALQSAGASVCGVRRVLAAFAAGRLVGLPERVQRPGSASGSDAWRHSQLV